MAAKNVPAKRRARSRWFGEHLSFVDLMHLPKGEALDELVRRLDSIEKLERAKARPDQKLLARIEAQRTQFKSAARASRPGRSPRKKA